MRKMSFYIGLLSLNLISGVMLASNFVSATDDEVVDSVQLTVPIACTMTGTGTTHTATLNPGTYSGASGSEYENGIGKTTLTAICNDDDGFSIYAIGYTGNSYDSENHTKLVGTNTGGVIATKAYASGDTASNWSMKLTKVTDTTESYNPQNLTIQNDTEGTFSSWHSVPASYTKVAEYHANTGSSTTDTTLGVKLETTYAAYIASNQPADTYIGQVKYTMVHPYTEEPLQPQPATAGCINYHANASNAVGTMGCQDTREIDWSSCYNTDYDSYCYDEDWNNIDIDTLPRLDSYKTSQTLLASNYSRNGYGFAGWSDSFDYATNPNAKFYGPQETVTFSEDAVTNGLSLYAVWIKSQGSIQDQSKVASICNSLTTAPTDGTANLTSVSALTDQRDNNTYAIAKLADGNCWMIENLRLESTNSDNSTGALAQGYGASTTYGDFTGLADAESANFTSTNPPVANSLYSTNGSTTNTIKGGNSSYYYARMPRYNHENTDSRASNPTANTVAMYSYGNYYTWAAAMASVKQYTSPTSTDDEGKTSETANTSLCPTGWRLPYGRNSGNGTVAGGFYNLNFKINNDTNVTDSTASLKIRSFPNNFLYSGLFNTSSAVSRGSYGLYWSSTANDNYNSYYLNLSSSNVYPDTSYGYKYRGVSIRCTVSAGT